MSEFYDSKTKDYQEENEDSDVEHLVQKDSKEKNECPYSSSKVGAEEESEEEEEGSEGEEEEEENEEEEGEDTNEKDTENEEYDSDDDGSRSSGNWEDNPHLDFIELNQQEMLWYLNYLNPQEVPQEDDQECNIDSFEDFLFSLNGIRSLNDLRGHNGMNDQNNRFVMLGDGLADGGAYEYYNSDGSYYSQRADGSIIRRDKFGRERVTPPDENPRMRRRYRPY